MRYYGKPLAEDELEKTIEANKALARWLDRLREWLESRNTSTTNGPERKES